MERHDHSPGKTPGVAVIVFLMETYKLTLRNTRNCEGPKIDKVILKNNKAGRLLLPQNFV